MADGGNILYANIDGEPVFRGNTFSSDLTGVHIETTRNDIGKILAGNILSLGLGDIISFGVESDGIVVCKLGVVKVDPKTLKPISTTGNLGIGEIKSFKRDKGVIIGKLGVSKIDFNNLTLIGSTENLGIGDISLSKENVGLIIGEFGIAKVNISTLEVVFNTKDLGIGKVKNFSRDRENTGILYIFGEFGIAKVNISNNEIIYNTRNLQLGEIIVKFDNKSNNTIIRGSLGTVIVNSNGVVVFDTRNLGVGKIIHANFEKGIFVGIEGISVINTKTSELRYKIPTNQFGIFKSLILDSNDEYVRVFYKNGDLIFNLQTGEIVDSKIDNKNETKFIPQSFD